MGLAQGSDLEVPAPQMHPSPRVPCPQLPDAKPAACTPFLGRDRWVQEDTHSCSSLTSLEKGFCTFSRKNIFLTNLSYVLTKNRYVEPGAWKNGCFPRT